MTTEDFLRRHFSRMGARLRVTDSDERSGRRSESIKCPTGISPVRYERLVSTDARMRSVSCRRMTRDADVFARRCSSSGSQDDPPWMAGIACT